MATACLTGRPSPTSFSMFADRVVAEEPFLSDIKSPRGSGPILNCLNCNELVYIPAYREKNFKYCSRKCSWEYKNKNDRVELSCKICSKKFTVIKVRRKTAKYCSRECYSKAQYGSLKIPCAVCGKIVIRPPSHLGKYKSPCCSIKCRGLLVRKSKPAVATSARKWLETRELINKCNRCDFIDSKILVIHHRDRNRQNNELDNLEVLCPNCHAIEHYGND